MGNWDRETEKRLRNRQDRSAPSDLGALDRPHFDIGPLRVDPPVVLAPVDGYFDLPFRIIAKRYGCGLTYSEMVNCNSIIFGRNPGSKTLELIRTDSSEGPYGVQLAGKEPENFAQAARELERIGEARLIDINMGCPAAKVVRVGSGAALMRDPLLAGRIVKAVVEAVALPVTVKMRAGWDRDNRNAVQLAHIAQEEGASAVTVHGRTWTQKFGGKADWEIIREVVDAVDIPVIGNGDVTDAASARALFERAGCAGIMLARGAFGKPWVLREILDGRPYDPGIEERMAVSLDQFDLSIRLFGEKRGLPKMRKHISWYVKGIEHAAAFRHRFMGLTQAAQAREAIAEFFSQVGTRE